MNTLAKPLIVAFHLPRWRLPRPFGAAYRRRQTTIDLIHSSPHLLRDIGVTDHNITSRGR